MRIPARGTASGVRGLLRDRLQRFARHPQGAPLLVQGGVAGVDQGEGPGRSPAWTARMIA